MHSSSRKVALAAAAAAAANIEPLARDASGHQHGSGQGRQEGLQGRRAVHEGIAQAGEQHCQVQSGSPCHTGHWGPAQLAALTQAVVALAVCRTALVPVLGVSVLGVSVLGVGVLGVGVSGVGVSAVRTCRPRCFVGRERPHKLAAAADPAASSACRGCRDPSPPDKGCAHSPSLPSPLQF